MNSIVLENETFVEKARKEMEALQFGIISTEKWEAFKAKIKNFTTTTGRKEAARKKEKRNRLMETISALIEANEERPGEFREDIRLIKELRAELENSH